MTQQPGCIHCTIQGCCFSSPSLCSTCSTARSTPSSCRSSSRTIPPRWRLASASMPALQVCFLLYAHTHTHIKGFKADRSFPFPVSRLSAGSPEEVAAAKPPPLPKGSAHCQPVEAVLGEGLRFVVGGQRVTFGDSPQDVCSEMGCPSSAASKALDHVSRGSTNSTRTAAADYFYSYEDR